MTLATVGIVFATIMASCGGSKGGHCDAYGHVNTQEQTEVTSVN